MTLVPVALMFALKDTIAARTEENRDLRDELAFRYGASPKTGSVRAQLYREEDAFSLTAARIYR